MASLRKEFSSAVKTENIKEIENCLLKGVNIDTVIEYSNTAFTLAVKNSNYNLMSFLLNHGSNINLETVIPPLFHAIDLGNLKVIEFLINNGADINRQFKDSQSRRFNALGYAIQNDKLDIIKFLLKKGTHINEPAVEFKLPVVVATENGNFEQIKLFIENGADVESIEHSFKNTLLGITALHGNYEIAKYFITKGANLNSKNENSETPLMVAVEANQKKIVELLINKGADLNIKAKKGITALKLAKPREKKEIFEMLIRAGAKDTENWWNIFKYPAPIGVMVYFLFQEVKNARSWFAHDMLIIIIILLIGAILIILLVNTIKYFTHKQRIKRIQSSSKILWKI
jgi:ankyrin repeat protein